MFGHENKPKRLCVQYTYSYSSQTGNPQDLNSTDISLVL